MLAQCSLFHARVPSITIQGFVTARARHTLPKPAFPPSFRPTHHHPTPTHPRRVVAGVRPQRRDHLPTPFHIACLPSAPSSPRLPNPPWPRLPCDSRTHAPFHPPPSYAPTSQFLSNRGSPCWRASNTLLNSPTPTTQRDNHQSPEAAHLTNKNLHANPPLTQPPAQDTLGALSQACRGRECRGCGE